jgi:hypothetical protein
LFEINAFLKTSEAELPIQNGDRSIKTGTGQSPKGATKRGQVNFYWVSPKVRNGDRSGWHLR